MSPSILSCDGAAPGGGRRRGFLMVNTGIEEDYEKSGKRFDETRRFRTDQA
jgi:hypothetical protein